MRKFLFGILFGIFCAYLVPEAKAALKEEYDSLDRFADAFERVRKDYLHDVGAADLIDAAIGGMVGSLDDHSSYLTAADMNDMAAVSKGAYGSVGLELISKNGLIKVLTPIDNMPAARAGIKIGDYIIKIDGEEVEGLPLERVTSQLRGPLNTKITLTIRRAGETKPSNIELTREALSHQSVSYEARGLVGYVRVSRFNEETDPMLEKAVHALKKQIGKDIKGYILDLRNNPGGLLEDGLKVTDLLLDGGEIVSLRGRNANDNQTYNARSGEILDSKPLLILINESSGGASEILAAAVQDHHRAKIVGEKSAGSGSIQTVIPLTKGGVLKLTTAEFFRPSGAPIATVGVVPDITVAQTDARADSQLSTAISELTGQ
jgi:carboxyl-terminal processing protease